MGWLTFIADMTKALAWPAAVVALSLLLLRPLYALLPKLSLLKFHEFEIKFEKGIEEVDKRVRSVLPASETQRPKATVDSDYLYELADISPEAAVMGAWLLVERSLRSAGERHGLPMSDLGPGLQIERLKEKVTLDPQIVKIFHDLRSLRDQAAHAPGLGPAVSASQASTYAEAAVRLATKLDSL